MLRYLAFFCFLSFSVYGQKTLLEGTIIDKETGQPVPFASIGVFGTPKGTSSNLNGEFSISVELPVTLKITCIGYATLILENPSSLEKIELRPVTIQLNTIVVLNKNVNTMKIMRKTFAGIKRNYLDHGFRQRFFYRHYCKDNDSYGRLIEAYVDVWKNKGYKRTRKEADENEEIRITQLRRSLDKTIGIIGHEPISIDNILEADLVAYQATEPSQHVSFYSEVNNMKVDFGDYTFTYDGITYNDGEEVYKIDYVYKKDSVLLTTGEYYHLTQVSGTLYITTDSYAIIKSEEVKKYNGNTIRTSAYYRKYKGHYYSYHLVRDGETILTDSSNHNFHIELMSVEIDDNESSRFTGTLPGKDQLLDVPYDSGFWATSTILKTTPLEDKIIQDLGGGVSLSQQFKQYRQFEINIRNGGENGEEKFKWLRSNSTGKRILYLIFWDENFISYLADMELAKRLHKKYQHEVYFVFLSLDNNQERWEKTVKQYNFGTDAIINYRIGSKSDIPKSLGVTTTPGFVLIKKDGVVLDGETYRPTDPLLDRVFDELLNTRN